MIHLLFEGGNSDLKGRTFPLPDGIRKLLKEILNNYDGDRNVEGYKRLNNILDMKTISYQEMKRLKNYFDNFNGDINSDEYKLNGGDALKTWVNNTLNTATTSIRNFKQAKKEAGIPNAFIKSHNKDRQTHNKLKPTQAKFNTNDISVRIKDNTSIKYEGRQRKTIYISEQQYRLIKEAQDATFNVNELSAINSFRGRYNYCLQHLGPTIGKGSSRTIFQLSDERVLKLAINTKGIAQNEQEGRYDYYLKQLDITPQIFEKDEDGKWLISEYVLPAKKQDFQECLGIDEKTFFNFLITSWVNAHGHQKYKYVYGGRLLNDELFYELTEREELMNWYDYISNYDMPLGDIIVRRNYGMTVRNGDPVIVLLDNGLTDEIYNNYYKR